MQQLATNKNDLSGKTILFVDQNNEPMFFGNDKKMNWYLQRNNATIVSLNNKVIVKINSKDTNKKGYLTDPFHLSREHNICVCCGSSEGLTGHHVVPFAFRKFFPDEIRSNAQHDILLICEKCHLEYNIKMNKFFNKIGNDIQIKYEQCPQSEERTLKLKAIQAAKHLLNNSDRTPKKSIDKMYDIIKQYTRKDIVTRKMINRLQNIDEKISTREKKINENSNNKFFIKAIEYYGIKKLSTMWRAHFVKHTNPKFLPIGWNVNTKI